MFKFFKKKDKEEIIRILKVALIKTKQSKIQLTCHDFESIDDKKIKIKKWKSGVYREEIIDVEICENEIVI